LRYGVQVNFEPPGMVGGFQPPRDGSHGGTEKYPDELRERAIPCALDLVDGP
jgi:hypothetical protein